MPQNAMYPGYLTPEQERADDNARKAFALEVERKQMEAQKRNEELQEAQKYGAFAGKGGFMK